MHGPPVGRNPQLGAEAQTRLALDGAGGVTDDLRGKIPAFGTKPGVFE